MAKAVKLADIAEKLGVSVVTVSKALSGQKGVSDSMREKIVQLADELGYSLPGAPKKESPAGYNIGVLIPRNYVDTFNSLYWQMHQQVAQYAMERDCFTLLEVISDESMIQQEMPKLISENKVDGVVVIGTMPDDYLSMVQSNTDIPFVFLDFLGKNQNVDSVISDNFYGAYYLTNYLLEMGHRDIAFVGTLRATSSITDRYLGYSKALLENGQNYRPEWVIPDRDLLTGLIDEEQLIQLPEIMPTAFFCNCDMTAGKLIRKLQKEGYRVPEDISVVGYDNYAYPEMCDVEITSYEVNFQEMAKRTVDTIVKKMGNEFYLHGTHIVEGRLIVKNSVRRRDPNA